MYDEDKEYRNFLKESIQVHDGPFKGIVKMKGEKFDYEHEIEDDKDVMDLNLPDQNKSDVDLITDKILGKAGNKVGRTLGESETRKESPLSMLEDDSDNEFDNEVSFTEEESILIKRLLKEMDDVYLESKESEKDEYDDDDEDEEEEEEEDEEEEDDDDEYEDKDEEDDF